VLRWPGRPSDETAFPRIPSVATGGWGGRLHEARFASGISIDEVARNLRIAEYAFAQVVGELEAMHHVPSDASVRRRAVAIMHEFELDPCDFGLASESG
jgi:hypothetical protein